MIGYFQTQFMKHYEKYRNEVKYVFDIVGELKEKIYRELR